MDWMTGGQLQGSGHQPGIYQCCQPRHGTPVSPDVYCSTLIVVVIWNQLPQNQWTHCQHDLYPVSGLAYCPPLDLWGGHIFGAHKCQSERDNDKVGGNGWLLVVSFACFCVLQCQSLERIQQEIPPMCLMFSKRCAKALSNVKLCSTASRRLEGWSRHFLLSVDRRFVVDGRHRLIWLKQTVCS